jgi:TRAP-type C4-dicarboxylate transport system permease small subunit
VSLPPLASGRSGFPAAVERLAAAWALLGGVVLLAIVAVNVLEVASSITIAMTGRFSGAVELTSLFGAVAAFCFLPYAQIGDANVTADIFTARAGPRTVAALKALAGLAAAGVCLFLTWRMAQGLGDQRARGLATTILGVPVWPAYVFAVVSFGLTALAAAVALYEGGRGALRGRAR